VKELKFNEVLRYAFSGGIGLATFLVLPPAIAAHVSKLEAIKVATLIGGIVLVIGVFVYNVHRALIFPLLFRTALLLVLRETDPERKKAEGLKFWCPYRPTAAETSLDLWRWNQEQTKKHWDEWGAQVHFLYCSVWAILGALVLALLAGSRWGKLQYWIPALCFAVLTLVAALVHHLRLLYLMTSVRTSTTPVPAVNTAQPATPVTGEQA
jgi:hypothetical protein